MRYFFAPISAVILVILSISESANILILHPIYCGSHEFVLRNLGDYLIKKGHSVTQVRFKQSNSHTKLETNVTVITLDIVDHLDNCGRYIDQHGTMDISKAGAKILWNEGHSLSGLPLDIFCLTDAHCHTLYNSQIISELLNSTKFDLAIVDLIANECGSALASSLNIPLVGFWGFSFHAGEVTYTGAFSPPSIYPAFFSGLSWKMSFLERLYNFNLHVAHILYMYFQFFYANYYIQEKFPNEPPIDEIVQKLEFIMVNSNEFVDYPRLLPPNVIQVGGLQIKEPKDLPQLYTDFINDAEHGVILFSLGYTGFSAKDMPKQVVGALVDAFASLDQKVIMRFDQSVMPYVPNNVLVSNWIPQQDLLAHPKIRAFFTHCGIGSVLESIYYGVPLVATGIFADQVDNAAIVEDIGVAVRLDKSELTNTTRIIDAINKVMEANSSYTIQSSELSAMWKDKMFSPLEEAHQMIERLLKFKTLRHLRMERHDLSLLQYFSIDAILVMSGIFGLWIITIVMILKRILWTNNCRQRKLKAE